MSDIDPDDWIPGSGASSHMSGISYIFSSLTKYEDADSVMIGNGRFLPITHVCTVLNTDFGTLILHNVLLVPSLK